MAVSSIIKTKRDGTLTISDRSDTHSLTIQFEAGDLSVSIPGPAVSVYLDRGEFGATPSLRYGDDQPITGSFSAYFTEATDAAANLADLLTQTGNIATSWDSTLGVGSEVQAYTLKWTIEGTEHGDTAPDHSYTFQFCVLSGSISEGDPNTISINFTAYDVYPTVT